CRLSLYFQERIRRTNQCFSLFFLCSSKCPLTYRSYSVRILSFLRTILSYSQSFTVFSPFQPAVSQPHSFSAHSSRIPLFSRIISTNSRTAPSPPRLEST